jgi:hypothetical protein
MRATTAEARVPAELRRVVERLALESGLPRWQVQAMAEEAIHTARAQEAMLAWTRQWLA